MKKTRLDALVKNRQGCSWGQAREWIQSGKIFVSGTVQRDIALPVDEESQFELRMNAPKRPKGTEKGPDFSLLFEDAHLIVVDKPAGLSSVPFERTEPDSLLTRLEANLRTRLRVVQRLDKETSGVMLFAKTPQAEKHLAQQFRFHTIERNYLAVAHGIVRSQTIRSVLIPDRGDGLRGSLRPGIRAPKEHQKPAITHVTPLQTLGNGAALIRCELETGRTHQIRIHLSEAGHPLVGERLYIRDYSGPRIEAPRILLHAALLGITHPAQENRRCVWKSPLPSDFRTFLLNHLSEPELRALEASIH